MIASLLFQIIAGTSSFVSLPKCDESLWRHVYHGPEYDRGENRLTIINRCIAVTGVIKGAKRENDGDWHLIIPDNCNTTIYNG